MIYAYPRTSCVLEGDHFGISVTTPFALKYKIRVETKDQNKSQSNGGGEKAENHGRKHSGCHEKRDGVGISLR